jgi:hypothetical protein
MMPFWIDSASDYGTLLHESGHATFGLKEEYCSSNAAEDIYFHSNTFKDQNRCITLSKNASTCRPIAECLGGGYWKSDPDDDPMSGANGPKFGSDCLRRAECIVGKITDFADCP